MIPPEARWQNSRAERHGGILQEILTKMDVEESIDSYDKLETCLAFATQTKNQWSRHRGYPPERLVFGKLRKYSGSTISDVESTAHSLAESGTAEGLRFRAELAIRERARKAFSQVDNQQAMRRAILQRTRPSKNTYLPGEWVMLWRENQKWIGPLKVVLQEDNKVVWLSMANRLYKAAPEQIRPVSAVEEHELDGKSETSEKESKLKETVVRDMTQEVSTPVQKTPEPQEGSRENRQQEEPSEQPDREPETPESSSSFLQTPRAEEHVRPEDIPVPVEMEDELQCECFHLEDGQGWQLEIDLNSQEYHQLANSRNTEEAIIFLAAASKKQKVDVKLSSLSARDRALFEQAKLKEITSWLDTSTVARIARHQIPPENIMRCRWILTWKDGETNTHLTNETASTNANRTPKARLVVLGYEDPSLHLIQRDSATLTKLGRSLLLQMQHQATGKNLLSMRKQPM